MIRSMIFKEWIKVRWFWLLFTLLGLLAVGYIFARVRHDFTFNEAKNYWYSVLFQGYSWFRYLKFIPLAGGVLMAVAQYFPETVSKRIKLTYHLPVEENKALLMMMLFGTVTILISYLLIGVALIGASAFYFPGEIILSMLVSVLPWFLAGLAAYYLGALMILEPVWLYRVLYFLVAAAFVPIFLIKSVAGAYTPAILPLLLFTVLLSIALLFSGYRFRKGEM